MSSASPRVDRRHACGIIAAAVALLAQCLAGASALEPTASPAAADTLDQLMRLLAQRQHRQAEFTEVRSLSVLSAPLRTSGVLIYDAPDHLEQRILMPRAETVILDHGELTMQRGKHTRSVPLAEQPQIAPLVDSMRALLAGERSTLEQRFTLHLSGSIEHWMLRLDPREPTLRSSVREIDMRGEGDEIREIQLEAHNGDRSDMQIQPRP